ncbi:pyroglutamyl-peptidase I [Bifidobacterium cuniculi]|uniref:Pyroglutamyl-peptidase I n=1 Tax=Bifidobacterium cuniculi TaxID=1688 RepID=A0A087AY79_9BIFI|nr:pyroglutamyl-peptidase I [Bifidobacterium cuniculi]KFI63729.1 pyrrolidone-carboxylate peptidase [Bifidobacterium cuniculi]
MRSLTVVISGFDPYEGVEANPALIVPDTLAAEGVPSLGGDDPLHDVQLDIHAVHMPVSFGKAWPVLADTLAGVHPDIVIATGLKSNARGILLERCAVNAKDTTRPDADNVVPRRAFVSDSGPAAYWTGLPLRAILNAFAHDDIPASLSSDAGVFVCNALFYRLQAWAAAQERAMTGFVNLPAVNDEPHPAFGLTLDQQVVALRDVVRESAHYFLAPASGDILLAREEKARA